MKDKRSRSVAGFFSHRNSSTSIQYLSIKREVQLPAQSVVQLIAQDAEGTVHARGTQVRRVKQTRTLSSRRQIWRDSFLECIRPIQSIFDSFRSECRAQKIW